MAIAVKQEAPAAPADSGADARFRSLTLDFLSYLELERGLSRNTLNAYRTDLFQYGEYLSAHHLDALNARLEPLKSFVLPAGTPLAAHLHMARTIARRAERLMSALADREDVSPAARRYANRLSDYLFVAARVANLQAGDVLWAPGKTR